MRMMQSTRMARQVIQVTSLLAVVLMLVLAAQVPVRVECQEQALSIESRQQKDNDDLSDTIKYLEKLDKYFSQIARPRYGRSEYKQPHRVPLSGWRYSDSMLPNNGGYSQQQAVGAAELLDLARSRLQFN